MAGLSFVSLGSACASVRAGSRAARLVASGVVAMNGSSKASISGKRPAV